MDDPWANAWTTPATTAAAAEDDPWKPAVAPVVPTWEPPAWPEDDDAMQAPPIWAAPPPVDEDGRYNEESSEDDDDDDDEPAAQVRDSPIEEAVERQDETEEEQEQPGEEEQQEPADEDAPATPEEHDAFGSFESADPGALSPVLDLAPDNAWAADAPESAAPSTAVSRTLWSPGEWREEDGQDDQDEWAAASARQRLEEERERRFPREAVDALISQWDALAAEIWPVPAEKPDEKEGAEDVPVQRLESLPGLSELVESLVPDYHLQPRPQFAKTALFKSLQTSLRLTKSYPMVQQSPLSQFYSSKGNSAWESAVKAKQVVKDDWPWETKPQEVAPAAQPQAEAKPAPARGILGLWRSRPSSMPPAPKGETTPRTASPAPRPSMDKPRPSIDSVRSSGSKDAVATTATTVATSSPVATAPTSPTVSMGSPTSSEPAPSAMSRLFGRFSRKAAPAQPSEMTLSNSDLSFLSDVVPSTSGSRLLPEDDILGELSASSMATARLPAPPALPPPPPLSKAPALPKPPATTAAKPQSQGWAFEDDDTDEEELEAMQGVIQAGAALEAMLGDGLTGFAEGYAPVAAARNVVAASRAGTSTRHQQRPSHTAALPSSVLAAERMNSPLPAPPSVPKRAPVAPPPATLFGGDEFDEFMSTSSPPMPQTRPGQAQPFQSPSAAPLFASPSAGQTPTFASPATQGTPTFQTPMMQPTPVFQRPSPAPAPAAAGDDFDDFGDFISLPSTPAPAPQSVAPPPPPPARRETRLPDPPRIGGRAPVAVMSRTASTSSLGGLPPALAPPPGGSRPVVVMSRGAPPANSSATPPPLLAPPPGAMARKQAVNLMEDANELIATPVSSHASTASSPVSPVSATAQSRPASRSSLPGPSLFDDFAVPPQPAQRGSLPASPVSSSPRSALPPQMSGALFDDLARPASRSSAFSSVPLVSSPLAPTKSPPPRMTSPPAPPASLFSSPPPPAQPANGDAFASLFSSTASPPPPPAAPQKNGKLSAADLSFFDSL